MSLHSLSQDELQIDGHKMALHPVEVARWLMAGRDWESVRGLYPLYVEISPFGGCNFRCSFCAKDFLKYKPTRIEPEPLKRCIRVMGAKGVKSVLFAGEGEPTLYEGLPEILAECTDSKVDCAMSTNGAVDCPDTFTAAVEHCKWIRFSVNAGDAKSHKEIHRCSAGAFDRVLANLAFSVEARARAGRGAVLGAQAVLLEENADSLVELARRCREIGIDYLTVKPYSQHPESITKEHQHDRLGDVDALSRRLAAEQTEGFRVHFRARAFEKSRDTKVRYGSCFSVPMFWAYLRSTGDVFGCSNFMLDSRFHYGNINETAFDALWEGPRRQAGYEYMMRGHDISKCRINCRMDQVNQYLWDLKNPPAHANFI